MLFTPDELRAKERTSGGCETEPVVHLLKDSSGARIAIINPCLLRSPSKMPRLRILRAFDLVDPKS
jgi:hypothetical protein